MDKLPISLDRSERINRRVLNQLKLDLGKDIKDIIAEAIESVHGDSITSILAHLSDVHSEKHNGGNHDRETA